MPEAPALVQIGSTALRAADGSFLPAVPIFVLADASKITNGLTESENQQARELAQVIAGMQQIQNLKGEKHAVSTKN